MFYRWVFFSSFVIQVISEKALCSRGFTSNLRDFHVKIIVTIIPIDSITNSLLSSFCPFRQTQQQSGFLQVGGLMTRNISVFGL